MDRNSVDTVKELWSKFTQADYDGTKTLFSKDIKIIWPTSREYFDDVDDFIEVNKIFGSNWTFEVLHIEETTSNKVISVTYVTNPGWEAKFFATSVFAFSEKLISEIKTYWATEDVQPDFRRGLSKIY